MKTLFWIGIICVALGLLSFITPVRHSSAQRFQAGGIGVGVSGTEERQVPAALSGTLIVGGLSMMVAGCREHKI